MSIGCGKPRYDRMIQPLYGICAYKKNPVGFRTYSYLSNSCRSQQSLLHSRWIDLTQRRPPLAAASSLHSYPREPSLARYISGLYTTNSLTLGETIKLLMCHKERNSTSIIFGTLHHAGTFPPHCILLVAAAGYSFDLFAIIVYKFIYRCMAFRIWFI